MTQAIVKNASSIIDAYLGRPQGLAWSPDAGGTPAYMVAPTPRLTLTCVSAVSPGAGVVVAYAGAKLDNNVVGEAVVLDRANISAVETCVITAIDPAAKTITLQNVQFAHAPACTVEFGMTIMEERELPSDRSITRVAQHPIMTLLSGAGRYGYGRRSQQTAGNFQEFNLLAVVSSFGGPPLWIPWDVNNASVSNLTGEIWVPAGVLLAYYTDVRVWYIAGFAYDEIPQPVKQACANICTLLKETGLGANIRSRNVRDGTVVGKFENNMIDFNSRQLLDPYLARRFI
jgi:hypothetical protein